MSFGLLVSAFVAFSLFFVRSCRCPQSFLQLLQFVNSVCPLSENVQVRSLAAQKKRCEWDEQCVQLLAHAACKQRGKVRLEVERAGHAVFTIILATNGRRSIFRTIRSIFGQSYTQWQLIIVLDGDAPSDVQKFLSNLARITKVEFLSVPEGTGISATRNHALTFIGGDIVTFIDDDNCWRSNYLSQLKIAYESPDVEAVYTSMLLVHGPKSTSVLGSQFDWQAFKKQNFIDLNTFSHRARHVARFPTLPNLVDWSYIGRIISQTHQISFLPYIGAEYQSRFSAHRLTVMHRLNYTKTANIVRQSFPHVLTVNFTQAEVSDTCFVNARAGLALLPASYVCHL